VQRGRIQKYPVNLHLAAVSLQAAAVHTHAYANELPDHIRRYAWVVLATAYSGALWLNANHAGGTMSCLDTKFGQHRIA